VAVEIDVIGGEREVLERPLDAGGGCTEYGFLKSLSSTWMSRGGKTPEPVICSVDGNDGNSGDSGVRRR
jgi:hypothetical protein